MDATLVTAWKALCQLLAPAFTQPTSVTFLHIATGWVLCRSKPTVTNLVCTIGRSLLIVRDPAGQQKDDYLFCTDPAVDDVEIIEQFSGRWPIEESFLDGKQLGEFEQVQGWCPRTVVRQAPLALIVQTLVKAWYLRHGVRARSAQPHGTDWMPDKDHPSYLDMLATLRKVLRTHRININSTRRGRVREILKTLAFTLCAAA